MIFNVVRILWFMFKTLIIYGFRRLFRVDRQKEKLENDYRRWARYVLDIFDADLRVEGRGNIPVNKGRKLVVMSNHQSQLDIPSLVSALDRSIGFVAKKELGRIPLLSYWMRQVGCIFIDRQDRRGAHLALEKAAREMGENPLVVFPEGTRSKDGNLLPFKLGGTRLAVLAGAQILPILIQGSRDTVENRKSVSVDGNGKIPVRLRIYPVMDVQGLEDGKATLNKIKDYVEQCWRNPNGPI